MLQYDKDETEIAHALGGASCGSMVAALSKKFGNGCKYFFNVYIHAKVYLSQFTRFLESFH